MDRSRGCPTGRTPRRRCRRSAGPSRDASWHNGRCTVQACATTTWIISARATRSAQTRVRMERLGCCPPWGCQPDP
eukprot:12084027-Alexandrium_andersonii.AAC.1